ncbi:MAG TPA: metal-dependent transcriptional regulator [Vicinamibacterales bacterium]|nr:metal-dependent transcriptional regulator [Vicinamibacterales bacterium]
MLPSSTVENYLKAILQHQPADPEALVPMGQIAAALNVTPGTATTMVKALAESGLVQYEPYAGVRLTPAGEKLAALVLRRHRLVELFLVQVMGMSWDEVHEEAEKLEHVVSERLIERMDEMLGRPEVDPHGDPIPDAHGSIRERELHSLLTCPLHTPVTVTRVVDQDADFLRFIEQHDLKPGQSVEVESRDAMGDRVCVRGRDDRRMTIGTRAASKLLVDVVSALVALLIAVSGAAAQEPPAVEPAPSHFGIVDNSFFVEEAFNQDPGMFQNIFVFEREGPRGWAARFVQEWPLRGMRHQLAYSLTFARDGGDARFSDASIDYRLQVWNGEDGRPAFAPRASLLLNRDDGETPLDEGGVGFEANLPFSLERGPLFFHWNGGLRWLPAVSSLPSAPGEDVDLVSPFVAGSVIAAVRPMLNLMLEARYDSEEFVAGRGRTDRAGIFTISPGLRAGWDFGDAQLVLGFAVPVARSEGEADTGALVYFSYEPPFKR